MESDQISEKKKQKLKKIYDSLNPAQLKRTIEVKLDNLYKVYQEKQRSPEVMPFKRLKPYLVTKYTVQQEHFGYLVKLFDTRGMLLRFGSTKKCSCIENSKMN